MNSTHDSREEFATHLVDAMRFDLNVQDALRQACISVLNRELGLAQEVAEALHDSEGFGECVADKLVPNDKLAEKVAIKLLGHFPEGTNPVKVLNIVKRGLMDSDTFRGLMARELVKDRAFLEAVWEMIQTNEDFRRELALRVSRHQARRFLNLLEQVLLPSLDAEDEGL